MPRHAKVTVTEGPRYAGGGFDPPYQGAPLPPLIEDIDPPEPENPEPEAEAPEVYDYEPIDMAQAKTHDGPFNGSPVMISDDETSPGVLAKWYVTRKRIGFEWKLWVAWVDPVTRQEIKMKPKFWRANPNFGAFW